MTDKKKITIGFDVDLNEPVGPEVEPIPKNKRIIPPPQRGDWRKRAPVKCWRRRRGTVML